jgi:adenine C2-methylase RlmN of 23S rRNA A2503 and tRNA A37
MTSLPQRYSADYRPVRHDPMTTILAESTATKVAFRPVNVDGYQTGALDISVAGRRILSIPSQLGCRVACSFCISKHTPLIRNLTTAEMLLLVQTCFDAEPADGRPVDLSFTGEGEPLLNWKNATACAEEAARRHANAFTTVRYCFSGIGASHLLAKARHSQLPVRLQLSLHAARQSVRDQIIPRSQPLAVIMDALRARQADFSAVELNVVLLDGINDTDADLRALVEWGDPAWPVLLNPQVADGQEVIAHATAHFADALRAAGRDVKVYSSIAAQIGRQRIYPMMSATPAVRETHDSIKAA